MKKIFIILCLLIVVSVGYNVCKYNNINLNNFIYKSVNSEDIRKVKVTVSGSLLGQSDDGVFIFDNESTVKKIIEIEDYVRKNDGIYKLRNCTVWTIEFEYNTNEENTVHRSYKGQCYSNEIAGLFDQLHM